MSKLKATSPAVFKGGPGSGHHGHSGRPGKRGGSLPGAGGAPTDIGKRQYDLGTGIAPGDVGLPGGGDVEDHEANLFLDEVIEDPLYISGGYGWENSTVHERTVAKSEIVRELSERTGLPEDDVNLFIKQWARSANDTDMRSLSIQEAASDEFGLELSDWQRGRINEIEIIKGSFASRAGARRSSNFPLLPRDQERAILRSMYENTQDKLSKAGFKPNDTVLLFRGYSRLREGFPDVSRGDNVAYQGNVVESWSTSSSIASYFGGAALHDIGLTVAMEVPVKNILGTARTGFGCLKEGEYVIFGVPNQSVLITEVRGVYD